MIESDEIVRALGLPGVADDWALRFADAARAAEFITYALAAFPHASEWARRDLLDLVFASLEKYPDDREVDSTIRQGVKELLGKVRDPEALAYWKSHFAGQSHNPRYQLLRSMIDVTAGT